MARARNIKPGFFTNETLAELNPLARLLFAGLWTIADRAGRLEDRPKRIKAEILMYDKCNPDALLESLHENGFILRYEQGGSRFIQILAWNKHQNPHVKEAPSTIPAPCIAPDEHSASTGNSGTSPADSGFRIPDSLNLIPDSRGTGPDRGASPLPAPKPSEGTFPLDEWADRLYSCHVKRRDRELVNGELFRILERCRHAGRDPIEHFAEIERCLIAWNATPEWQEKQGRFAPKLAEWLRDAGYERWPAEPSTNGAKSERELAWERA